MNETVNVTEATMRREQRPTLVQRWIVVTDESGAEHLEARWVVEGEHQVPATHAA